MGIKITIEKIRNGYVIEFMYHQERELVHAPDPAGVVKACAGELEAWAAATTARADEKP